MPKLVLALLFIFFGTYLGVVFWANRGLYSSKFDATYWQDRFEHSQWQLPKSQRTIGDDGLYLYEGYRLVRGDNLTKFNPEVPPLGKYLIGLSVVVAGNGHIYGFVTTTLALITFFLVASIFLKNLFLAAAATLLLTLDPLITSQFPLTMLDSLQLLFLLLALLCLMLFFESKKPRAILTMVAGLAFGLFSASKIPLFSPILVATILLLIWKHSKSLFQNLIFLVGFGVGYLLPYLPYFLSGQTLFDWLRLQKYVFSFYLHGYLKPKLGNILTTLLLGQSQNIFTQAWEKSSVWSPLWPLVTFGSLTWMLAVLRRRQKSLRELVVLSSIIIPIMFYLFVPFWTRYLVIVLPLLYLTTVAYLAHKFPKVNTWIGILVATLAAILVLFPTPEAAVRQFTYDWEHGFFQDMYENIASAQRTLPRNDFQRFGQSLYYAGQIEAAKITLGKINWSAWKSRQEVSLTVVYQTRNLGPFTQQSSLPVINENGRWQIDWNWNLLIAGLTPQSHLETTVEPAKRGNLISQKKILLAGDQESFLIWIVPRDVDRTHEEEMLKFIEKILSKRIAAFAIHNRYVENSQPDWPVPIGTVMSPIKAGNLAKLKSYPGVLLTPALGRFTFPLGQVNIGQVVNTQFTECCSVLYNTTTYAGLNGLEKDYNEILKGQNGGTLKLVGQNGQVIRKLLDVPKKDGQSVEL